MKLKVTSLLAFLIFFNEAQGILQPSNDETQLISDVTAFLRPYSSEIRQWFWRISGVQAPSSENLPQSPQGRADYIGCDLCMKAVPIVRQLNSTMITEDTIISVITMACIALKLAPRPDICEPTIRSYAHSVLHILNEKSDIPEGDFCGIINPGCANLSPRLTNWKIRVSTTKPQTKPRPELPSNQKPTKILQFTDVHLDLDYTQGMNADCHSPVCCRAVDGPPPQENASWATGGKYGHFGCALPPATLDALYDHAKTTHQDTRFIFLTGDYVHSGVWLYSENENGKHIREVTTKLKERFPNIPIYPLTGNHEPAPVNMYAPMSQWGKFNLSWMYDAVAEPFTEWIPPYQLSLFKKYGYYSVTPVNDTSLRIIVVNTNICYVDNFWLPFDPIDPNNQLQWLSDTLAAAEDLGQHVIILGHIQPGSGSCWPVWSNQYNRIINRYEAIIRGQFYGHSHEQYYTLAFEDGTDRPISVSYVAGSTLTDGMNSAYNVYLVDGEQGSDSTWEVMDQQTWILNLNQSNTDETPAMELLSEAKKNFNLTSMRPEAMYDFVKRMVCDDELFNRYQVVAKKGRDTPRFENGVCLDNTCKGDVLGELLVSNSADLSRIQFIKDMIEAGCTKQDEGNGSQSIFINISLLMILMSIALNNLM